MTASGYVRQSAATIASGQSLASAPVNNEFNQLQAAFSGTSGHDHSGGTGLGPGLGASAFGGLTSASAGIAAANGANSFNVVTLTGTSNQITVTNGTGVSGNPTISIATGYVGQTSITTLGTIGTGVWSGTTILGSKGGTGAANSGILTYGASNVTFTTSGVTTLTLPTSGTVLVNSNNLSDVSSATTAANNLLPSQTGNNAKFLTTNGTGTLSWATVSGASGGTVTSITFTGDGTVLSSTPSAAITTSGTIAGALANAAAGTVLGNATTSSATPTYSTAPVHGNPGSTNGTLGLANGGASGQIITIKNLGCTGAYNFNLPIAAGTSGQVLTSGAGGSTSMTWTTLATVATTGSAADLGSGTLAAARMPALTGDVTTSAGAVATTVAKIAGVTVSSTTGTTNVVFSASPTLTGTLTAATITASAAVTGLTFIPSGSSAPTNGMFLPAANTVGFSANSAEALRINSSGHVIVQGTSDTLFGGAGLAAGRLAIDLGNSTTTNALQISCGTTSFIPFILGRANSTTGSLAYFVYNSTNVGAITTDGTNTAYATSSDARMKSNVRPIDNSGEILDAINPVKFKWEYAEGQPEDMGCLAQDLYKVYPKAVNAGDDDLGKKPDEEGFKTWNVDYSKLVPLLLAEVKDLRNRIYKLENA